MTRQFHTMPRSIRGRLTALATLVAAGVLVSSAVVVLAVAPDAVRGAVEDSVELAVQEVAADVRSDQLVPELTIPASGRSQVQFMEVTGVDGQVLATVPGKEGALPVRGWVPSELERPEPREFMLSPDALSPVESTAYHVVAVRVRGPRGQAVVYGAGSLKDANRIITAVRLAVFAGTPFVLAVVALVTWLIVGLVLRPVERIRAELSAISGQDLGRRVPVPEAHDEIGRLARTTNDTLERLERSARTQRRFIADASHELRSPLAGLRTELEVAADDPERTDWEASNARALAGVDRMSDIIEELLILARLDAGARSPYKPVDVAELAAAQLERRAESRVPIHGRVAAPAMVTGSRLQLDRLLTNLLDNAVRHATSRVTLRVAVEEDAGQVVVEVADDGAGIAPGDRERVFERFTRLPEGRTRDPGGSGLGLPLSREIASAHGGTLELAPGIGGARFVVRLPARTPQ